MVIETNISIMQYSAEPNKTPPRISKQRLNKWRVLSELRSGQQQDGCSTRVPLPSALLPHV